MGEESRVKIKSHSSLFRKVHPSLKMLRLKLVTVCKFTVLKHCIACMYIDFFLSRHQAHSPIHICKQLLGIPCLSRIISCRLNAAGQGAVMVKPHHVVPLPAVQGNRNFHTCFNGRICIHT